MARHAELFQTLLSAFNRLPVKPVNTRGGSVNYKLMDAAARYLISSNDASRNPNRLTYLPLPRDMDRWQDLMRNMSDTGHMSLTGPRGVACEQGACGAHWTYNIGSIMAVYIRSHDIADDETFEYCESVLLDELALNSRYRTQGVTCMPCTRLKDEKSQVPTDGYRDTWTSFALGENPRKPAEYFRHDLSFAVRLMRDAIKRGIWTPRLLLTSSGFKLYLPIDRRAILLTDGGYVAFIDRIPKSIAAMGRDACDWVRVIPGPGKLPKITFGVDWKTPVPSWV